MNRTDHLPLSLLLAVGFGLIPSALVYHFLLPLLTSADVSFELLWQSVWRGELFNHDDVLSRINRTWPELIQHGYSLYITGALSASAILAGSWVALTRSEPLCLPYAVGGYVAGAGIGWLLAQVVNLPAAWGLLAMPIGSLAGAYFTSLFTAPPLPEIEVVIKRGTRIVPYASKTRKVVVKAIENKTVCLAGYEVAVKEEVRSFLMLGASGTGKSVAIDAMMHTIRPRGDRMMVADPNGAAMSKCWQAGDVILNPMDMRSVSWDLLGEIEQPSDYKHLAESILPFTGDAKIDEWRTHSQGIFAACLKTWHEGDLGSTDRFLKTMAQGGTSKLRLLCQGTSAASYFDEGGERMLTSILSTLNPSLTDLETLAGGGGEPFSVRRWVRDGSGALWMPYKASQIAALRGPVSCWMRLGIFELLDMEESDTRRMWYFLDELDAMGRIQGLKDAMVRGRKVGGCIVAGIQSIGQIEAVYGQEAQTVTEQFGTQLVLKCGASEGGGTARFASDLIGEREVERLETSTAHHGGQGGKSITTSSRTQVERAVLPSEITQLRDLKGYLRVSGDPVWRKLSYQPLRLSRRIEPSVPIVRAEPAQQGSDTTAPQRPPPAPATPSAPAAPLIDPETGYPRMSWPFSPEQMFNMTAELYGATHPNRPAWYIHGDDETLEVNPDYERGWTDGVWIDYRHWWLNAPEEERYQKVMAALNQAGLELAGFDGIPEVIWEELVCHEHILMKG